MNRAATMALALLMLFAAGMASAEEPRHREFTKAEIKKMAKTKVIMTSELGEIKLEFYPDIAPNHVDNFIQLAKSGFYNDTTFHRVEPGFVIQGGDPNSKRPECRAAGAGNPGYTLQAEFSDTEHVAGILSMARGRDPNSGGSQFFIVLADAPHLNGQYSVFGEVYDGMDVVEKVVEMKRTDSNACIRWTFRVIEPADK